mgnify:FL=1
MKTELNILVKDEFAPLEAVILGIADDFGGIPNLEDAYDPKSIKHIKSGTYPVESSLIKEMNEFSLVLEKYHVKVYRPKIISQYNQIFSRDIAFVIDDQLIVPNILEDRALEYDALMPFVKQIRPEFIKKMPPSAYAEGGDVILDKEYIFVGVSDAEDFKKYTVARTNYKGVSFLEQTFPLRKIKSFELNKSDHNSYDNALHLDCCFQPIGSGMAILYSGGFKYDEDVAFIVHHYGKENIIEITKEEMYHMNSNIFSISPKVIVSNDALTRLNSTLRQKGFIVEEIPYSEVSKMGGLLRCSTLPLRRKYHD